MANDADFIKCLLVKAPHEKAPEYVKARLSIKREELIAWLESKDGEWINADVKVSQNGKWYCAVDNWKPNTERQDPAPRQQAQRPQRDQPASGGGLDDDIPFAPLSKRAHW